jgi:hypothetical protein
MGRTVLPFSQELERQRQEMMKFRRGLRIEDQEAFDALYEQARYHAQAAVMFGDPDPILAFMLSVMIEHWKMMNTLEQRIRELETGKNGGRNLVAQ